MSSATSKAPYCLKYWETQLGKTLDGNGTIVAKKTLSSTFNSSRPEDFLYTIEQDTTIFMQWRTEKGYSMRFAIMTAHHQLICSSSVSPCLSEC